MLRRFGMETIDPVRKANDFESKSKNSPPMTVELG